MPHITVRSWPVHPGAIGAAQHSPTDRHLVPIFADMFRGPLTVLLLRLGLVAAAYTVLRVLFWLYNQELFPTPPGAVFLGGLRFDASAIAWSYMPWTLLVLVVPRPTRTMDSIQFGMFLLVSALSLFFACVDLGYYAFSLKRSTADFLQILAAGNDTISLAPIFIRDYWHILLVYIVLLLALAQGYRWSGKWTVRNAGAWYHEAGWRLLAVGGLVLTSRGGTQLIPLQPLDAARYGGSTYLPVVLNTPFTMLMSLGKPTLAARTYMPQSEADALWPVVQELPLDPALDSIYHQGRPSRPNVVIIILESFSALYSAELAGGSGHMPFLDSLMRTGINCTEAYANGRRSIDGIPAVLAGMPQWMDEAFITSPYAGQPFTSLASVLGAKGYRTSFYHGGRNGTMGFDGFVRSAGFSSYHGLDEYPARDDFDGHWGIRDRPYLRHHAQQLAAETEPFLSAVFTLSSHHPYELPPEEAARFEGTNMPIQATLRYTDDALRGYFGTVRTMPWYRNTLFVITADHTADLERKGSMGNKPIDYWVPLIYHAAWLPAVEHRSVTQHIDILPTVLDLVGHRDAFFAFGHSILRKRVPPVAIWSNNGIFTITDLTQQVQFDGDRVIGVLPLRNQAVDPTSAGDLELHLQAAIQQYNKGMLGSSLTSAAQTP